MARGSVRNALAAVLVLGLSSGGCAPKQRVPLDLGPHPVELYVDGEPVEPVPAEVELRSDRDHKLYVKHPGYVPELVVLETAEVEGRDRLEPQSVRVRLEPVQGGRDVEIDEVDEIDEVPPEAGAAPAVEGAPGGN